MKHCSREAAAAPYSILAIIRTSAFAWIAAILQAIPTAPIVGATVVVELLAGMTIPPTVAANVLDIAGSTIQFAMTTATECVGPPAIIVGRVFVAIVACGKVVTSTMKIAQNLLPHLALVQV